ncbi:MAG: hypothetical protein HY231_20795 [Acidobacteria bacterium]|nr:hypothetical protein [Acidobacteriota bacterium]
MSLERIQRAWLSLSFFIAALLLLRFAVDFFIEMPLFLALPFALLVAAAFGVAAMNLLAIYKGRKGAMLAKAVTAGLLIMIPLGFLASSLDCTGLSLQGCTPFCTFIKVIWIPLMASVCAVYFITQKAWLLTLISVMGLLTLAPHCQCFNVGNGWWIERLGASPMCYVWGFVISVIAISALQSGVRWWPALVVNAAIIGGALTFFISHHYFHFPW